MSRNNRSHESSSRSHSHKKEYRKPKALDGQRRASCDGLPLVTPYSLSGNKPQAINNSWGESKTKESNVRNLCRAKDNIPSNQVHPKGAPKGGKAISKNILDAVALPLRTSSPASDSGQISPGW